MMSAGRRTNLDLAREWARIYRAALKKVAPERCAELDERARARGQRWVAPTFLPPVAADKAMDAVLAAKDIEEFWGIPAATIWGWSSKGLLTNRGQPRAPRFLVSEVLEVEGRGRKPA